MKLVDIDEAFDMALNNELVAAGVTLALLLLKEKVAKKEIDFE